MFEVGYAVAHEIEGRRKIDDSRAGWKPRSGAVSAVLAHKLKKLLLCKVGVVFPDEVDVDGNHVREAGDAC